MAAQCLNGLNGSLLPLLAATILILHSLVLQVTAVSPAACYKGVVLQANATDNSTANLEEGAILIVHCRFNLHVYRNLIMTNCKEANNLRAQIAEGPSTQSITWLCHIPRNTSWTIDVLGIPAGPVEAANPVKLFDLDIEADDLEQCLTDTMAIPSPPCTTPPWTEPATTSTTIATTEMTFTTETTTTVEASTTTTTSTFHPTEAETTDPIASLDSTDPSASDTFQRNETTRIDLEEVKEYSLISAVCVLSVIVVVQFWVIVKLCCRKRREKDVEEGELERVTDQRQTPRRVSQPSSDNEETVIHNRGSMDVEATTNFSIPKTNSCIFF